MGAFADVDTDRADELVFDWNEVNRQGRRRPRQFTLWDETMRDGLQNPSVRDPPVQAKIRMLHRMRDIGIDGVNLGLPSSSTRAYEDVLRLCREAVGAKLDLEIAAAGRTVVGDITPIVEISQKAGAKLGVYAFIGSSPIRQYVEAWDVKLIAKRSVEAIDVAVKAGLPVAYVTEDTTRSSPEVLTTLFRTAIDHGVSRLCLSDTVGHATPDGVRNLIRFTKDVITSTGANVGIDWHGHNDRGLALENALWALECGADRIHGTALGIGERAGNAPMELILLNLRLLGQLGPDHDLSKLVEYCETIAAALGWEIPANYPLVGRDAFRTTTGVHAAAIHKAMQKGNAWLADRVYSGVPAGLFGRRQEVGIGFMSGASNVHYWLREHGIAATDELAAAVLKVAKDTRRILTDDEVMAIVGAAASGA